MGGSGLDWTDDLQKFCGTGLDRIQFLQIRIGLWLKNFPSSLISDTDQRRAQIRTGSGLKPILAGWGWIGLRFFENWRIGTGWDWEFILFWCDSSTNIETVSCDVILQICMEVYIFRSVAKAVLELFCYASTFVQTSHSVGIVLLAARWTQSSS